MSHFGKVVREDIPDDRPMISAHPPRGAPARPAAGHAREQSGRVPAARRSSGGAVTNEPSRANSDIGAGPLPGAPGPVSPPADEPERLTEPLPPKPDQDGPETVSPTGQATGTDQARVAQGGPYLTTAQGARPYDSDHSPKAGPRGPVLLQDHHLREKITHFDHERIPERVVHALGAAAHGVFLGYGAAGEVSRAAFLAKDVETPVFVRFSTVLGSRGSADTVRDTRGFATKFYTDEGTFDLVGNVVAQKAATIQKSFRGPVPVGAGLGENLNEHIVGAGWPAAHVRLDMLEDAVDVIRRMLDGENVSHHGAHFDVENARLWDVPDRPPPIGIAVSGPRSCELAGTRGDLVIATEPKRELLEAFDEHGGAGKPRIGQVPVCYATDREAAVARAHDQFRWALGGWRANGELPGPDGFEQAVGYVRPEDVAESIACGDDVDEFVDAVRPYAEAGFTEVALVRIGSDHQQPFLEWAEAKPLPALRALRRP
ncbi:TIGR03557 family F420-dependent LLM class oxidoreductase [Streptomyces nojiriensis]